MAAAVVHARRRHGREDVDRAFLIDAEPRARLDQFVTERLALVAAAAELGHAVPAAFSERQGAYR